MRGFFTVLTLVYSLFSFSQIATEGWKSYFSYNRIVDISDGDDKLYVATENAFFTLDKQSLEMEPFSTVDGLSGNSVTCAHYSKQSDAFVLGYDNGLLQVYSANTHEITSVVEIKNKQTISGDKKVVNHMTEYNGMLYIACDFGISVYDIDHLEFDDTYYLGPNGAQMEVKQTAVYQGYLYAATTEGMYRAFISNDNIIDFENWSLFASGDWSGVVVNNGTLCATKNGELFYYTNGSFNQVGAVWAFADLRSEENRVLVSIADLFMMYTSSGSVEFSVSSSGLEGYSNVNFTCAYLENGILYLGTYEHGLLALPYPDVSGVVSLEPPGPAYNSTFSINLVKQNLWVVFGEYTSDYNPYGLDARGISIYKPADEDWVQIPYDSLLNAKELCSIAYNPNKVNQVYIGSFFSGVVKVTNEGEIIELFNENNSSLEDLYDSSNPTYSGDVRISGMAFDDDSNLWIANSKVNNGVKVMRADGTWGSYSIQSVISSTASERGFKELVVTRNGFKFISTANHGVMGFYENNGSPLVKLMGEGEGSGNLPDSDVRALALDQNNQLWIGTVRGLRVLYNISSFFSTDDPESRSIIITEEGEASELLYQQWINDIFVDGANNKWIATGDSGAFYISSNGQETIYHFTTENSPLPSNSINQIVVNKDTGEVFFATDKGIVSFKGTATAGKETLSDVYAYPNPVRPQYEGVVTLTNLTDDARVKITDIAGNLVFDGISSGGTLQWNLTAFNRYKVTSGVYLALISSSDGEDTQVCKIMVIR